MIQELVARLRFAVEHIPMAGRNVLDYGCGTGASLAWLRWHGVPSTPGTERTLRSRPGRCVGLDVSEGAIAFARRRYPEVEFHVLDIESPPHELRKEFDVAICLEVIEHLHRQDLAMSHLASHYLKPEGTLLITTPNRPVFSAGAAVSPTNRTHIREMDLDASGSTAGGGGRPGSILNETSRRR